MSRANSGNPFMPFVPASPKRIDSQAKGKRAERQLAAWWRDHGFPDASRAVKTGDRFQPDGGDLVLVRGDFRLVVEVKHHAGGLSDLQVAQFGTKLGSQVAQSSGTMGVLVERRDGVADPGRWWAHVHAGDFSCLYLGRRPDKRLQMIFVPVRCSVGYFAQLLQQSMAAQEG